MVLAESIAVSAMDFSGRADFFLLSAIRAFAAFRIDRFAGNGVFLSGPFAKINQLAPFTAKRSIFI